MISKTKSKKRLNLSKNDEENLLEGTKIWGEFYRKNPHRLVIDYLEINLFLFQCFLLYLMNKNSIFVFIASRGLGKSFLTALFCVVRCILYPGTEITLASGSKGQAGLIITEKIENMRRNSVALDKEILFIRDTSKSTECHFKNGSVIKASVSGDTARGKRSNILIADEYRLIKKDNIDSILKQFLTEPRRPKFLDKPEYQNYPIEPNKELYLSSAWMKSHWSYDTFINTFKDYIDGADKFACDIPYICSLDHRLLTKEKVEEDRKAIGEIKFEMEYCGLWFGENENSYFKSDELNQCRILKTAFIPLTDIERLDEVDVRVKNKSLKKNKGEIRIISADIAIQSGQKNDNSIYTLGRMLPNGNGYVKEVLWMESHNGLSPEKQAIRLKELVEEFQADKLILDTNGNGIAVMKEMQKTQYDPKFDKHYPAYTSYNKNSEIDEDLSKGAIPIIYALKPNAKINSDIAIFFKNALRTKNIRLLMDDNEKRQELETTNNDFFMMTASEQIDVLMPFLETTSMVYETVNLEYTVEGGNIRISERGAENKDRYSSISYFNYLAELIESEEIAKRKKSLKKSVVFLS